ncbi:MAG: energy-coupling factor transporter ATPase [Clostridia bacterium]|nr:energy-coupling factor transporter ATPase [Clostridia bacterium]
MCENNKIIKLNNLEFSYESTEEGQSGRKALDGVTLEIEKGSFVAVLGSNGSGKSTLAKHLNALLLPTGGSAIVCGMDTLDPEKTWDIRMNCGMVFQNPDNQLVSSIVEDDVAFGPENLGIEPSEIRRRVDEALSAVGMYEHRKKGPHLLSGGQKQRIAIAGVIAMAPECIVFDEPTAMLDPSGRREILEIIKKLHKEGKTVILITHFMEEAAAADRVIVMDKGRVAFDEPPAKLFALGSKLEEMHLELPFAAVLRSELEKQGVEVPESIIDEEGLAEFLCR